MIQVGPKIVIEWYLIEIKRHHIESGLSSE